MKDIKHKQVENLLWDVHDDALEATTYWRQHTVSESDKLTRIVMLIADLSLALAGGYRKDGKRE